MKTRMGRGPKQSIRTVYNGTEFRSKLEADWARVFDYLGVEWVYERRGEYFGDTFYLPDFWLPKSRQHVEVKAEFEPADCRKIFALLSHVKRRPHTDECRPDIALVACMPSGAFLGWERRDRLPDAQTPAGWFEFLKIHSQNVELFQCTECRGWWFCDPMMSWACQCCGAYDGNRFVSEQLRSPLSIWKAHVTPNSHEADQF